MPGPQHGCLPDVSGVQARCAELLCTGAPPARIHEEARPPAALPEARPAALPDMPEEHTGDALLLRCRAPRGTPPEARALPPTGGFGARAPAQPSTPANAGAGGCLPRRQAHLALLSVCLCSLGMAPSDDCPCPFRPVCGALRRRCLHSKSPRAASPKGPRRRPQAAASGDCRMI